MLKHLQLHDFRNHHKLELEFGQVTILLGPNGVGKTNVLEAIRMISLLKSFRARAQSQLIAWGKEVARIVAKANDLTIELALTPAEKVIKVNGVPKTHAQALGVIKTVLFAPDDVGLFQGPPVLRRRFLDGILAQSDRPYLNALAIYQAVLRQRNATLAMIARSSASLNDLTAWDGQLVEQGQLIHKKRQQLIKRFNDELPAIHEQASGKSLGFEIKPTWSEISPELLAARAERDIILQSTSIGPHHDDFAVLLADKDVGRFGSRGENRTVVFSLKIAELNYLGQDTLLLLDDIFSELDHNRRQRLQQLFKDYQTIITTTDEHYISSDLAKTASLIRLE